MYKRQGLTAETCGALCSTLTNEAHIEKLMCVHRELRTQCSPSMCSLSESVNRLLTLRITRVAAHLSDLVAAFDVIRLAMTVAERTVSLLPERSINSMGSSPRSCLIERA